MTTSHLKKFQRICGLSLYDLIAVVTDPCEQTSVLKKIPEPVCRAASFLLTEEGLLRSWGFFPEIFTNQMIEALTEVQDFYERGGNPYELWKKVESISVDREQIEKDNMQIYLYMKYTLGATTAHYPTEALHHSFCNFTDLCIQISTVNVERPVTGWEAPQILEFTGLAQEQIHLQRKRCVKILWNLLSVYEKKRWDLLSCLREGEFFKRILWHKKILSAQEEILFYDFSNSR